MATSQITALTAIMMPDTARPERNLCRSRLLAPVDSNLNDRRIDMLGIVTRRERFGTGSQQHSLPFFEPVDDLDRGVVLGPQQQLAPLGALWQLDPGVKGRPLLYDALDGNRQNVPAFVDLNPQFGGLAGLELLGLADDPHDDRILLDKSLPEPAGFRLVGDADHITLELAVLDLDCGLHT